MGTEASNWVNRDTLEQAPQGMSEADARAAGYVALSQKQKDTLDALRGTAPMVAEMQRLFDPENVGPAMGRFNSVLQMVNAAPQQFADLKATTARYRSEAARAAAGSAIGPAEREVYFSTYPDVNMSPQQFKTTLSLVETGLRIARSRILGGGVPSTPEVPVGQEVTLGGNRVVIEEALAGGALKIRDPLTGRTGVWRP
jgi:hypothetical protein